MAEAVSKQGTGGGSRVERRLERLNRSERALWLLLATAFVQTLVFIPVEPVLVPFVLANRERVWRVALATFVGVMAAAVVGYWIGYFLFGSLGRWALETLGYQDAYGRFRDMFAAHGFWAIVVLAIAPIPFQVAMVASGAAEYPIWKFVAAASAGQSIRIFGLGLVVWLFGDRIHGLWERHHRTATTVFFGILVLGAGISIWLGP